MANTSEEPQRAPKVSGRYRKVEVRTWGDAKFRALSPLPACGQGLWLFLITGPHTGPIPGLFRAGRAAMAEELGWELEDFDEAFLEVFQQGMVEADFKARVMWIPKAIRHNKPESPNVVKSWAAEFDLIPECDLKWKALDALKTSVHALGEAYGNAFDETLGKACGKPCAKTCPNQEQEQEQERKPSASSTGKLPPCPHSDVIDLYHEVLPELPAVRLMNEQRKKTLTKVWCWALTSNTPEGARRATTAEEALEWFRRYFERARANDFLMGRSGRRPGHEGWECDLDFLLSDRGMKQVIEKTRETA